MYRQGDVLLVPVEEKDMPDGLKEVPRDSNGRLVLAEGEATGHAHVLEGDEVKFLAADLEDMSERFLRITQEAAREIEAWRCEGPNGTCFIPADVEAERIEATGYAVKGRETVRGLPLVHDEHLPQVVEPGDYRVTRQQEYTEAGGITRVAD